MKVGTKYKLCKINILHESEFPCLISFFFRAWDIIPVCEWSFPPWRNSGMIVLTSIGYIYICGCYCPLVGYSASSTPTRHRTRPTDMRRLSILYYPSPVAQSFWYPPPNFSKNIFQFVCFKFNLWISLLP